MAALGFRKFRDSAHPLGRPHLTPAHPLFPPKPKVANGADGDALRREFKLLVREAHARGIEVILDVVFNHTAEGNEAGPTLSMRGLDNRIYYMLAPGGFDRAV